MQSFKINNNKIVQKDKKKMLSDDTCLIKQKNPITLCGHILTERLWYRSKEEGLRLGGGSGL